MTKRVKRGIATLVGMFISYLVGRYLLFDLHGMYQWPDLLALAGLAVCILSWLQGWWCAILATLAGYPLALLAASLVATEGTDPGGGATSNLWILWTVFWMLCMLIGRIADSIRRRRSPTP